MPHEFVRAVKVTVSGKLAAKCSCGDCHPLNHDEMDVKVSIKKSEVEELSGRTTEPTTPAPVLNEVK